ncbi:MAG: nickel-type superoxide dismutase maturation protease [Actinomycetota bacterium]
MPALTLALGNTLGTRQDDGVLPFTTVRVVGASMEPTVRNGQWWVVGKRASRRPGDVVLLRHPLRPHLSVVKRLDHRTGDGWWVLGDNPDMSDDSREFGVVAEELILGRLLWRYR